MDQQQPDGDQLIRRSNAQILELIIEFNKNLGITIRACCKLHKVTEGSFYTACKRYRTAAKSNSNHLDL